MFDYKNFVLEIAEQVPKALPEDIGETNKQYIEKAIKHYSLLIGEKIANDSNYSDEEKELLTQFVSEWTFHKGIDLCRANISSFNKNQILEQIANNILLTVKKAYEKKLEKDKIVVFVEQSVNKIYKEEIEKLNLSQKEKEYAKIQSNIDKMINEEINQKRNNTKETKIDYSYNYFSWLLIVILYLSAVFYFGHSIYFYVTAILIGIFIFNYFANIEFQKMNKELENIGAKFRKLVEPETYFQKLDTDILILEIGSNICKTMADLDKDGKLLVKTVALRESLTLDLGYVLPPIRIKDNISIGENCYNIYCGDIKIASGEVFPDRIGKETAEDKLVSDFKEAVIINADKVINIKHTYEYINFVKKNYSEQIADDIISAVGVVKIKSILSYLVQKKISIRNIGYIFEQIYIYAENENNIEKIVEQIISKTAI